MQLRLLILFTILLLGWSENIYSQQIKNYNRTLRKTEKQLLKIANSSQNKKGNAGSKATPDLYWIQQYLATMDPSLGRPTPEVLLEVFKQLNETNNPQYTAMPGTNVTPWTERGPNNVGGRTRALAWDPIDPAGKKVWAGCVTGGLWYNNDITNVNSSWQQVSGLWSNLAVSALAFDPNNPGTMYVGTGEGYGNTTTSSRGYGIWKSVDSGKTFTHLTNSQTYYYVNDLVVRNESGNSVLYVAVDAVYFGGQWNGLTTYGLYRSTNGGNTYTSIAPNAPNSAKYAFGDLEIGADNALYAGTKLNPYSGTDKGGGRLLVYVSGSTWVTLYTNPNKGRVELACAPGNANIIYAVFEAATKCDTILVTHNAGKNWSQLAKPDDADNGISKWDFTRGQAWYDLILAVDPNDTNTVVIGGIDLFKSADGGNTWYQISKWSNNKNLNTLSCSFVHADQHAIVFKKGNSSICIFGNDGGVFYTNALGSSINNDVIEERNKNYNTTQFYWGDLSATSGNNLMLAGAQDNGTQRFTTTGVNATTEVLGGDGAACFISPTNNNTQIASTVYNNYDYTTNNWANKGTLIADGNSGSFINPAEWDNNGPGLFTAKTTSAMYRIKLTTSPGTLETITWTGSGTTTSINAFKLSNGKSRLFIGTDAGNLYKTEDAWATSPSFSNIKGSINAGSISDIFNLRSGDTIAAVLSNYGVNNIYISINGGSAWTAKDGNLPNQPVWSIVLNPNKIGEAVIATETGVYGTTNIFASSPVWSAYTEGMGAVKIATLRYRTSDQMLMAVTHGRGVFTSDAWGKNTPIAFFGPDKRNICSNASIEFKDSSANGPTQWEWTISPANHFYVSGTDSTSQNPKVKFTKGGAYSVTLKAANQLGASTITRNNIVIVTDTIAGVVTLTSEVDTICAGDSLTLTANTANDLLGTITNYKWKLGGTELNNTNTALKVLPSAGLTYQVTLTSSKACVSPNPFLSNTLAPAVLPVVKPKFNVSSPNGCSNVPLTITGSGTDLGMNPVYKWYIDGTLQVGSSSSLNIAIPTNGKKVWATVNVAGKCILPSNTIFSDTKTLLIFNQPISPVVSRNFDTLFANSAGVGTYTWYRNGNFSGNGKVYRAPVNGTYRCVYMENACASDSSSAIVFNSLSSMELSTASMRIWPVPANESIFLFVAGVGNTFKIYNNAGVLYQAGVISKLAIFQNGISGELMEIEIRNLPNGIYRLQVGEGTDKRSLNFIKN